MKPNETKKKKEIKDKEQSQWLYLSTLLIISTTIPQT